LYQGETFKLQVLESSFLFSSLGLLLLALLLALLLLLLLSCCSSYSFITDIIGGGCRFSFLVQVSCQLSD